MKIAFVTNLCPHYRVKTFELLAQRYDMDFYFFSAGDDWYYQSEHGIQTGEFKYEYLPGFRIGGTRVTPGLAGKLMHGEYDLYIKCINGRFALPVTYAVARIRRKPFVLWTGIWTRLGSVAHRLFFPATRHIYRNSDAIAVYGEHVKRYLVSEGVRPEKIFVAEHAVDNELYAREVETSEKESLRNALGLRPKDRMVLYIGRLEREKGLTYLLDAFAGLGMSDAVLVLAGSGKEREDLERYAKRLGIAERVHFPGYVPQEDTTAYYAMASVFVLPSISLPMGKEPWGLVVNEAFNQGTPVIASEVVGAAAGGLVRDGVNGFVVPERSSEGLADALRRVLADESIHNGLCAAAQRTVAEWTNERMVTGLSMAIESASAGMEIS